MLIFTLFPCVFWDTLYYAPIRPHMLEDIILFHYTEILSMQYFEGSHTFLILRYHLYWCHGPMSWSFSYFHWCGLILTLLFIPELLVPIECLDNIRSDIPAFDTSSSWFSHTLWLIHSFSNFPWFSLSEEAVIQHRVKRQLFVWSSKLVETVAYMHACHH